MLRSIKFREETLPLREEFGVAGARCVVRTDSRAIAERARALKQMRGYASDGGREFRLDLREGDKRGEREGACGQMYFRGLKHLAFATLASGDRFVFDLSRRHAAGEISPESAGSAEFWERMLVPIAVGLFATSLGMAPLHCACLEMDGKGILIAAEQGAGKSTLAAALAQAGFAFLADEHTYATLREGKLVVHGLSQPLKLLPEAARFFPQLAMLETRRTMNGEMALEVNTREAFGVATKMECEPRLLLFLERREGAGCEFVRCSEARALEFFAKSSELLPEQLREARESRDRVLREASRMNRWTLRTGETPQATARAVREFCEARWN